MQDKAVLEDRTQKLIIMTSNFCNAHLNEEYGQLCEKLIRKMARKRNVPFLSGRLEIWAAAVVYVIGQINFIFYDGKPHITADIILNYFGTSKSTTSQKAKYLRDALKITQWDAEFSTKSRAERNPFSKYAMVNGLIMPVDMLPPEIREVIKEKRAKGKQ